MKILRLRFSPLVEFRGDSSGRQAKNPPALLPADANDAVNAIRHPGGTTLQHGKSSNKKPGWKAGF
jgi:hypothetical protein